MNFTMTRTWLGDMHLVALYDKALSGIEVLQNFTAGADRNIVLNEYLPNPIGDDDASKPDGEWVELYNLSDTAIDVDGWYLYDALDSHPLPISVANSDNDGDTGDGGETIVPASGYLIVYLDGAHSGWLNNSGGDTVRLYNGPIGTGVLVDSTSYSGSAPENKSYARIPDGIGGWVDPIPTPLAPNTVEEIEVEEEMSGGMDAFMDLAEALVIEMVIEDTATSTATTTEEIILDETIATSTVAIATTTTEMIVDETATSTVATTEEILTTEEEPPTDEEECCYC